MRLLPSCRTCQPMPLRLITLQRANDREKTKDCESKGVVHVVSDALKPWKSAASVAQPAEVARLSHLITCRSHATSARLRYFFRRGVHVVSDDLKPWKSTTKTRRTRRFFLFFLRALRIFMVDFLRRNISFIRDEARPMGLLWSPGGPEPSRPSSPRSPAIN